jgi:hypothetical protein
MSSDQHLPDIGPVYFYVKSETQEIISSNVPPSDWLYYGKDIPDIPAPDSALSHKLHLPQFVRDRTPVVPFYPAADRAFARSRILRPLMWQPESRIEVRQDSNGAWTTPLAQFMSSLEHLFLLAITALQLRHPVNTLTFLEDPLPTSPNSRNALSTTSYLKDAQARLAGVRHRFKYLLAQLSWCICNFDRKERRSGSWLVALLERHEIRRLFVTMPDGQAQEARFILEELSTTVIADFTQAHGRVGTWVNPHSKIGDYHLGTYLTARLPVFFRWGRLTGPVDSDKDNVNRRIVWAPRSHWPSSLDRLKGAVHFHGPQTQHTLQQLPPLRMGFTTEDERLRATWQAMAADFVMYVAAPSFSILDHTDTITQAFIGII